jgi:membrane-associated protease RseP (regulator of RpoE activity)
MKTNLIQWFEGLAVARGVALVGLAFVVPAAGQTLPVAGNVQELIAQDIAGRNAIDARNNAEARDSIRGVREQENGAARTATQLNRDARQEARQAALQQAAGGGQPNANVGGNQQNLQNVAPMNVGLRGADLGVWLNNRPGTGLTVADLVNDGAFAHAGFREGDRILSVNGQSVITEAQFVQSLLNPGAPNQTFNVIVFRNGQQFTIPVRSTAIMGGITPFDPLFQTGLLVDQSHPNQIVVNRVFPRTPAFYAGLRPGDVITSMNGQPIAGISALTQALQSGTANKLGLQITRNGQMRDIMLTTTSDGSIRTAMLPGTSANSTFNITSQSGAGLTSSAINPGAGTTGITAVPSNPAGTTGLAPSALNPIGQPATFTPLTQPSAATTPTSPGLLVQPNLTTGVPTATPGVPTAVPGAPTAVPGVSPSGGLPPTGVTPGASGAGGAAGAAGGAAAGSGT